MYEEVVELVSGRPDYARLRALLDGRADPRAEDREGYSLLHLVCHDRNSDPSVVRYSASLQLFIFPKRLLYYSLIF